MSRAFFCAPVTHVHELPERAMRAIAGMARSYKENPSQPGSGFS